MFLGQGGNSELFWSPLKALVSVKELVSVDDSTLRYGSLRSGGEEEYRHMLLVLGWWSQFSLSLVLINQDSAATWIIGLFKFLLPVF